MDKLWTGITRYPILSRLFRSLELHVPSIVYGSKDGANNFDCPKVHRVGRKWNAWALHGKFHQRDRHHPRHYPIYGHTLPDIWSPNPCPYSKLGTIAYSTTSTIIIYSYPSHPAPSQPDSGKRKCSHHRSRLRQ